MKKSELLGPVPRNGREKGFSIVAAFVLIAVLMGVVVYFMAGRGISTSVAGSYGDTARASAILGQAGYLQSGFDAMVSTGVDPSKITFDQTATYGLFNASTGGAQTQLVDQSAISGVTAQDGFWAYRKTAMKATGVGSGATSTGSYGVVLSGLRQQVCEQINKQLYGSTTVVTHATLTKSAVISNATKTSPTDTTTMTDFTGAGGTSSWDRGCFQTKDSTYVYFQFIYIV
jgi:hypothetical protein